MKRKLAYRKRKNSENENENETKSGVYKCAQTYTNVYMYT